MNIKRRNAIIITMAATLLLTVEYTKVDDVNREIYSPEIVEETVEMEPIIASAAAAISESISMSVYIPVSPIPEEVIEPEEPTVSDEEIELIALVTMAEAEGESEYGKRLVIDTILNRVDGEYWPDTISEVIYQPNQFTSMWNGRIERCEVRDDICQLVKEEMETRTNEDVVFFQMYDYSIYGEPMFQEGCHYFSSYE